MSDLQEANQSEKDGSEKWNAVKKIALYKYRDGLITRTQYFTYLHLAQIANMYGIASISNDQIASDILGKSGKGKVNLATAVMLRLKAQRLVSYKSRGGKSGSYNVKVGYFVLPGGKFTKPEDSDNQSSTPDTSSADTGVSTEVSTEVVGENQRLGDSTETVNTVNNESKELSDNRGNQTNTDTVPDDTIKTDYSITNKKSGYENKYRTADFDLTTYMREFGHLGYSEQEVVEVYEMAKYLHEDYMDYLLVKLREGGFGTIEDIFGLVKERMGDKTKPPLNRPGSYFNMLYGKKMASKVGKV